MCRNGTRGPWRSTDQDGSKRARCAARPKGASGTSSSFQVSDAGEARGAVVSGPGPIGALDSILMLQGMDDSTDGKSKAAAHGEKLLDMLDEIRDGLLAGGVPRTTLNRLANAVTRRHDQFNDPKAARRARRDRAARPCRDRQARDDGQAGGLGPFLDCSSYAFQNSDLRLHLLEIGRLIFAVEAAATQERS
ncbi:MAG: flagellar assembly protein FliX [Rhizomicrobium sp.]